MRPKILTAFFLSLITISVFAQDKWDLQRCVNYAIANNISVKQADIQARIAGLTLKQSRLAQYPTLNASVSSGINSGRSISPTTNEFTTEQLLQGSFNLQTGANLFNWFSQRNTIAGNRLEAEAAAINIDRARNDISLNVAQFYLQTVVSQEQIRVAEVAILQTTQNLDNTRKRVEAGALPELNLAELEAQLARDSASWWTAVGTVTQNVLQLKALLALDAAVPFEVDLPPLERIPVLSLAELEPEAVFQLALTNFPQQKYDNTRIEAAKKFEKAAKGQMFPTLSIGGGLGSSYANNTFVDVQNIVGGYGPTTAKVNVGGVDYVVQAPTVTSSLRTYKNPIGTQLSDNFRQNVGLQLNIPVFNAGSSRIAWQRAKLNIASLELVRDQDLLTLKQNIYTAHNDAVVSTQKFMTGKKSVATAEKAYFFAQKRYEQGLLSTIDLLTNQNNLTRAKVELLLAQVDYVFRLKLLEFYKGQGLKLQ
jgi:outer membrane protein